MGTMGHKSCGVRTLILQRLRQKQQQEINRGSSVTLPSAPFTVTDHMFPEVLIIGLDVADMYVYVCICVYMYTYYYYYYYAYT